jgi:NADH-quinone oxidoreductase subunit N
MVVVAGAENLVTLFVGFELLSIPLYVLCAGEVRRATSLEAGLKYLVIGSVGSATLLYGLALVYGATGATDLSAISGAIGETVDGTDPLLLTGVALIATGLAFKASVAPFHQWTPDVYQGAPTPITAFMAVATKAAAFALFLRIFDVAFPSLQLEWAPALAAIAVVTIVIGNVGAIAQRSLKRMLAWSGVAQAGYLLAGVVVGTKLGLQATFFYLAVYLLMNVAAFAVVIARERVDERGSARRARGWHGR